jgi:hypothetical protein
MTAKRIPPKGYEVKCSPALAQRLGARMPYDIERPHDIYGLNWSHGRMWWIVPSQLTITKETPHER